MSRASGSNLRAYYRARAPEYDEVYRKPERQADLRQLEGWVAAQFSSCRVLEIACGTGYWTPFIAASAAHVTATDAAPETLAIARERVPVDHADMLVADAYALPETLGRFEAAFAGFWVSHVPKTRLSAFVAGLHARLEPGATVVFVDNRLVPGSSLPIAARDAEGNTYQDRRLRDGSAHRVLKNFLGAQDFGSLLHGVATAIEFRELQYFWTLRYELGNN